MSPSWYTDDQVTVHIRRRLTLSLQPEQTIGTAVQFKGEPQTMKIVIMSVFVLSKN